ncbi:cysteine desulfurase family protein [Inmirania thermothiophila]|uniref:cysteine desulfurase n=1 Tax=Inmirania thermothiophila TaxID=1750597 RepID=A0A3N1XXT3_9GAMM|nr:cysteine desulfurase family protein [Inmirania thermothiophila]ROR29737.1 cysteine desulfurase [Inmirania thermothiophila]
MIYLDYAATTPADPRVVRAMQAHLGPDGLFANPSATSHAPGRQAAEAVERARARVAALIGAREVLFTSGATEANNLAVLGMARALRRRGRHVVTCASEHPSVLDACRALDREGFEVTVLAPDEGGRLAPERLREALRPDTVLVSVMLANNETGVVQDVAALAELARGRGAVFHTDAVQAVGRMPVRVGDLGVDLLSFTAHKLYGPKGVGALWIRDGLDPLPEPLMHGGGQERGLRPGTLPTHQIVGFAEACRIAAEEGPAEWARLAELTARLEARLAAAGMTARNGDPARAVPGILNMAFCGVDADVLLSLLEGVACASGAACHAGDVRGSHVLRAMGLAQWRVRGALRLSLGRYTTAEEVEEAAARITALVARLRAGRRLAC